jgi:hypothetical protein
MQLSRICRLDNIVSKCLQTQMLGLPPDDPTAPEPTFQDDS